MLVQTTQEMKALLHNVHVFIAAMQSGNIVLMSTYATIEVNIVLLKYSDRYVLCIAKSLLWKLFDAKILFAYQLHSTELTVLGNRSVRCLLATF